MKLTTDENDRPLCRVIITRMRRNDSDCIHGSGLRRPQPQGCGMNGLWAIGNMILAAWGHAGKRIRGRLESREFRHWCPSCALWRATHSANLLNSDNRRLCRCPMSRHGRLRDWANLDPSAPVADRSSSHLLSPSTPAFQLRRGSKPYAAQPGKVKASRHSWPHRLCF